MTAMNTPSQVVISAPSVDLQKVGESGMWFKRGDDGLTGRQRRRDAAHYGRLFMNLERFDDLAAQVKPVRIRKMPDGTFLRLPPS